MTATAVPTSSTTTTPPTTTGPRRPAGAARSNERTFTAVCHSVLLALGLLWLIPFAWALVTSLRPESEIATNPTSWWSSHWTLSAYRNVIQSTDIGWWYLNSFIIAALSVVFTVVVCSMIAFGLARTRFRAKGMVAALVLIGLMIPTQVLILPHFLEFKAAGLLGTYWAVFLPTVSAPVAVFVFRAFMAGLPDALFEAARVDGASWWRVYRRIAMPLCRPAISAVSIFTFVTTWNSLLWPLLVLNSTRELTIPVGLASVQGGSSFQYAEVLASAVLGLIPLLAVFLLFQRQIVQGVASTGIK